MPAQLIKNLVPAAENIRVKYKDVFDLKAFYEALHEWLLDREWRDPEEEKDHWETYYAERMDQSGAREIWIEWRATKKPSGAPFLQYYLDLDFHCIAITSTEIVRDGMKLKVNKGEVELILKPQIEKKYEKEFEKSMLLRPFTKLFTQRTYRIELEQRKKELYQEAYELQNWVKHWFKLKRYLPYEETKSFSAPLAWPSHMKE